MCRKVHANVTGHKARQRARLDSEGMEECWTGLEEAWLEFDALRQVDTAGILTPEDVDRFVSGWQVRF